MVEVRAVPVDELSPSVDVIDLLRSGVNEVGDGHIIVLPRLIEDSEGWYPSDLIYSVKELRRHGADAQFLHGRNERRFLNEHSAGSVVWTMVIGMSANLSTDALKAFWTYVVSAAEKKGGRKTPSVRIEVARVRTGDVKIEGLVIEGEVGPDLLVALGSALGVEAPQADD